MPMLQRLQRMARHNSLDDAQPGLHLLRCSADSINHGLPHTGRGQNPASKSRISTLAAIRARRGRNKAAGEAGHGAGAGA